MTEGEAVMRIDIYTKIVLTVVAIALCALAVENVVVPAKAQFSDHSCGSVDDPCWVATKELDVNVISVNPDPLPVVIMH